MPRRRSLVSRILFLSPACSPVCQGNLLQLPGGGGIRFPIGLGPLGCLTLLKRVDALNRAYLQQHRTLLAQASSNGGDGGSGLGGDGDADLGLKVYS